jgi:hypothetical protein
MSKAKITAKDGYTCAPEGHTVITYPHGTIVHGHIAEMACADHAARRMFDPVEERKVTSPPETKVKRARAKK